MTYRIHFSPLKVNDGPLKGETRYHPDGEFVHLDRKKRLAYFYRAFSPPWKRLRRRSAYYVNFTCGPLTKREMRIAEQMESIEE